MICREELLLTLTGAARSRWELVEYESRAGRFDLSLLVDCGGPEMLQAGESILMGCGRRTGRRHEGREGRGRGRGRVGDHARDASAAAQTWEMHVFGGTGVRSWRRGTPASVWPRSS